MAATCSIRPTTIRVGVIAAVNFLVVGTGQAQVTTAVTPDSSLPTPTVVTQVGSRFDVTAGTRPNNGTNLFHSFSFFDIATGDTVSFLNDSGLLTDNIISRVTGGDASDIYGTINTTDFGNTRFFLINPTGTIFGPSATINVPGAFYASTADFIEFADGSKFHADLGNSSSLTLAAPSSFGFINPNPSKIDVQGLSMVSPFSSVNLIAGQRDPVSGLDVGVTISGDIRPANSGSIGVDFNVVSLGGLATGVTEGFVNISGLEVVDQGFAQMGALTLDNAAIRVNGDTSGSVYIRAGEFFVDTSRVESITESGDGGNVTIDATNILIDGDITTNTRSTIQVGTRGAGSSGDLVLTAADSFVLRGGSVVSFSGGVAPLVSEGAGGDIRITARTIELRDREDDTDGLLLPLITSQALSSGPGGDIVMTASESIVLGEGRPLSIADGVVAAHRPLQVSSIVGDSSTPATLGGSIVLQAPEITLSPMSDVASRIFGDGRGGNILLDASDVLNVIGGNVDSRAGVITTDVPPGGSGGDIQLRGRVINLSMGFLANGETRRNTSLRADTFTSGDSGNIDVRASEIINVEGATLDVQTLGPGNAGQIYLSAPVIQVDSPFGSTFRADSTIAFEGLDRSVIGNAGAIVLDATERIRLVNAFINSGTVTSGTGGDISITAPDVFIEDTNLRSETAGPAPGGNIHIEAENGVVISFSILGAVTWGFFGDGDAGNITIAGDTLDLPNGLVTTSTLGAGRAGSITLEGNSYVNVGGVLESQSTAQDTGAAGNIRISGGQISLTDGAFVNTRTASDLLVNLPGDILLQASGGSISIAGAEVNATTAGASDAGGVEIIADSLTIDFGQVTVSTLSTGSAGSIQIQLTGPLLLQAEGLIESQDRSDTADSGSSGSISIAADSIEVLDGGQILATTNSDRIDNDPASIQLAAESHVRVSGPGSRISVATTGASDAGNISIDTATLTVDNFALISASTSGAGDAGAIVLSASDVLALLNGGWIESASLDSASGSAGSINISAPSMVIDGGSAIFATTASDNEDNAAASITITADDEVVISNGARVSTTTTGASAAGGVSIDTATLILDVAAGINASTRGAGDAGAISVTATDALAILNGSAIVTTSQNNSSGSAGSINITAPSVNITGGGLILATTASDNTDNAAASITIAADNEVVLSGSGSGIAVTTSAGSAAGGVSIETAALTLDDLAQISASTSGAGAAGAVSLTATDTFSLLNNSVIESASLTSSSGSAGSINITAPSVNVTGGGQILATTASDETDNTPASVTISSGSQVTLSGADTRIAATTSGASDAGGISIETSDLALDDLAQVTASTTGSGSAGLISISATNMVVDNGAQISSSSSASGQGGSISLSADLLEIFNDGEITATSLGTGNAGSIDVSVGELGLYSGAAIETSSEQSAGGNISVQIEDFAYISSGTISASANGVTASDNGGNVTIGRPEFLVINDGVIRANANAGNGGNILLSAETFIASADSVIDASSNTGLDGEVIVDAPNNIVGVIVDLEASFGARDDLLSDQCAAAALGNQSSFIVDNLNALPPSPGGYVPSALILNNADGKKAQVNEEVPRAFLAAAGGAFQPINLCTINELGR